MQPQASTNTEIQAVAYRILDDAMKISTSPNWHEVEKRLVSIQRAARSLVEPQNVAPEVVIAAGYLAEVERQMHTLDDLLEQVDGRALLDPATLRVMVIMLDLMASTLRKYTRAAEAASCALGTPPVAPQSGVLEVAA